MSHKAALILVGAAIFNHVRAAGERVPPSVLEVLTVCVILQYCSLSHCESPKIVWRRCTSAVGRCQDAPRMPPTENHKQLVEAITQISQTVVVQKKSPAQQQKSVWICPIPWHCGSGSRDERWRGKEMNVHHYESCFLFQIRELLPKNKDHIKHDHVALRRSSFPFMSVASSLC